MLRARRPSETAPSARSSAIGTGGSASVSPTASAINPAIAAATTPRERRAARKAQTACGLRNLTLDVWAADGRGWDRAPDEADERDESEHVRKRRDEVLGDA